MLGLKMNVISKLPFKEELILTNRIRDICNEYKLPLINTLVINKQLRSTSGQLE
jgi:hypothetical protein